MTRRLAVIAVAALALAGCAKNTPSATPSAETSLGASGTPTASPTGTSKPPTPAGGVTTAPPTGPQIVFFRIKTKPSCPSSGPGASFPGNPIELEWKVTGGPTNVTISIDGPGIFGTYTLEHTEKLPFACEGSSGTTQKHTYLLKTIGGGPVQQQTITGEARVN